MITPLLLDIAQLDAKVNTRNQKYKILDNFLNFWFCFIYRNLTAIEIENFSYVKRLINRDYSNYCSPMLERFFRQLLAETGRFNKIGLIGRKEIKTK